MTCRDIEPLLLAEPDGALTPEQHAALGRHVASCPDCRQRREALRLAQAVMAAEARRTAVPDADATWLALQQRIAAERTPVRRRPLAPVIWLGGAVAAAAAIALAFLLQRQGIPAPATPPVAAPEVASADYVEAGNAKASTMVYVDKDSGWLVVWASDPDAKSSG